MSKKFVLKEYGGERFSAEQWCYECYNKYGFDIGLQIRKLTNSKENKIISSQKIYYNKPDKYGQCLNQLNPDEKIKLYFNDQSREEITKTEFFKRANDGDTILSHWIGIDHDFDHKPIDFTNGKNPLFKVLRKLDERALNYFVCATEEGRGIKIILPFKELLNKKNIEILKKKTGEHITSLIGGELKLTGNQCSFCYPAKEGEEPVHASAIASLAADGLSFVNPQIGEAVNLALCIPNPILCVQGKVVGAVYGEAMGALAEASPEAAKAVSLYNQVKGQIDRGAQVVEELQINEQGVVESGKMEFAQEQEVITDIVGDDIEDRTISASNVQLTKAEGTAEINVKDKGFLVIQKTNSQTGKEETYSYNNIKKDGKLYLDEQGEVIGADFTTNEKGGTYVFGNDRIAVPPNSDVLFVDGNVLVSVPENSVIKELPTSLEQGKAGNLIQIQGDNVHLQQGAVLDSGRLSIMNGELFVQEGDYAIINGLAIEGDTSLVEDPLRYKGKVSRWGDTVIYLDGKEHSDSTLPYVSLNPEERSILIDKPEKVSEIMGNPRVTFVKGNNIVKIEDTDYFSVSPSRGSSIFLRNRDGSGYVDSLNPPMSRILDENREVLTNGLIPEAKLKGFVEIRNNRHLVVTGPVDNTLKYLKNEKKLELGDFGGSGLTATPLAITSYQDSLGNERFPGQQIQVNALRATTLTSSFPAN